MSNIKSLFFVGLLSVNILSITNSTATNKVSLDLEGDGRFTQVTLPFNYYKKQDNDRLTLIHQGGYKVYNIANSENGVAVIGTLRPCIGIVVTDGVNLITFHKHSTNSLDSMEEVIKTNLNTVNIENLHARIYTTRDDLEWTKNKRQQMHGKKTHLEEVKEIKDFLNEKFCIIREQIPANLKNLRNTKTQKLIYNDNYLGMYDLSEICIAIRLNNIFELSSDNKQQIKFSSIDPFTEDVFGYKGTKITEAELVSAPSQSQHKNTDPADRVVPYDQIPQIYLAQTGKIDGYKMQRGICERRLQQEEQELYFNNLKINLAEFLKVSTQDQLGTKYNCLTFYPITQ